MRYTPWYTPPVLLATFTDYTSTTSSSFLIPSDRFDRFTPFEVDPVDWPPHATGIQLRAPLGVDVPGGPRVQISLRGSNWPGANSVPDYIRLMRVAVPGATTQADLPATFPTSSSVDLGGALFAGFSGVIPDQVVWTETQPVPTWYGARNSTNTLFSPQVFIRAGWLYQPPDYRFIFGAPPLHQRQRTDGQGGGPEHHGAAITSRQYGLFARGIL